MRFFLKTENFPTSIAASRNQASFAGLMEAFGRLAWCGLLIGLAFGTGCDRLASTTSENEKELALTETAGDSLVRQARLKQYRPLLSDYGLFEAPMKDLNPAAGIIEYDLNTPLFTDYAQKQRLIKLPPGTSIDYSASGPLRFPVGTIIAKTFYYAADIRDPQSNRDLVETRILELRESGWVGIPYLWNADDSDARLAIAGANVDVSWIHNDGQARSNTHAVPNLNDCKRCHLIETMQPIGPKASNLNRDLNLVDGSDNQLARWIDQGVLSGAPAIQEIPRLAQWDHADHSLDERARAYLDVNCAHCHQQHGPARNSGLHLNIEEIDDYHLGVFKTPVAAGKGTGGRLYGIVPGKPDESILEYRMRTVEPGEIMPEFGKSLVHQEGLELIRQWIAEME